MTSIIPSFVLVDSNNLAKDRYCEVHRNGMVVISLVSGTPDPSRCLRDLWWRPRDLDPTSHPEIQEMEYSTSMMCSVVLVTCTRLPACCVSVCLVVLGMEPSHIDILSKSIHVYGPIHCTLLHEDRSSGVVEDMYRHPMDGLDMSP